MENEKYGIVITAITEYFKKGMQEISKIVKTFGKEAEEETTITPKLSTTGYQKQIDYVKQQMEEIQDTLDISKSNKSKLGPIDIAKLEAEYETLSYKLEDLLEKQNEFNGELEETEQTSSKTSITLTNMFDRSIGKIKRFTFYLLGARSVFSLFMKYQGIYYQYNEQMQYQSELSQNAIALSLAPAFELLGNVIAYASIGFAKFIELLTGVNVLSKVSTKGIRDYNKGLKESRSLLSGIDEITNLSLPSSTGLAGQYQALNDFQKKVAEVEKFFKENKWIKNLVDGLRKVWERLKEIIKYIKDHWDVFKYIIGGVALTTFLGFALTGGGGLGIMALTATLTILGLAEASKKIEDMLDEIARLKKQSRELSMSILNKWPDVFDKVIERIKDCQKGTQEWKRQSIMLRDSVYGVLTEIINGKLTYEEYSPIVQDLIKKLQDLDDETFSADIDLLMNTLTAKEDYEKFKKVIKDDKIEVPIKFALSSAGNGAKAGALSIIDEVQNKLNNMTKKNYVIHITTQIMSEIGKNATSTANALSQAITKAIRGYANGLDYVPYDNYPALLHKGEAVVPAKYNTSIHSVGNEYTNSLLETLIVKMDDLAQRPNVFEIDGQKFANATYNLYDNARSSQNYVEGVVR